MSEWLCDCCERQVSNVRRSMWHGTDSICLACFYVWYDEGITDKAAIKEYVLDAEAEGRWPFDGRQIREWGRPILATAEASVEHGSFGAAWRDYVASTEFNKLPEHDRALIRVAFVSGWRARGIANG